MAPPIQKRSDFKFLTLSWSRWELMIMNCGILCLVELLDDNDILNWTPLNSSHGTAQQRVDTCAILSSIFRWRTGFVFVVNISDTMRNALPSTLALPSEFYGIKIQKSFFTQNRWETIRKRTSPLRGKKARWNRWSVVYYGVLVSTSKEVAHPPSDVHQSRGIPSGHVQGQSSMGYRQRRIYHGALNKGASQASHIQRAL